MLADPLSLAQTLSRLADALGGGLLLSEPRQATSKLATATVDTNTVMADFRIFPNGMTNFPFLFFCSDTISVRCLFLTADPPDNSLPMRTHKVTIQHS